MADPISGTIFVALVAAGAPIATSTVIISTVAAHLIVGSAVQLISSFITKATTRSAGREDLKRLLASPTSLPNKRHVVGKTRAVGSLLSWPVDGSILWGCWLLNSRPSDMSELGLLLDERSVEFTGDPFDFDDLDGATATNDPFAGYVNFWIQRGDETTPPVRFTNDLPYDEITRPEGYMTTDGWQGRTVIWMRLDAGPNDQRANRWPSAPPLVEVDARYSLMFDPTDPAQDINDPSTWLWSNNQGVVTLDGHFNNLIKPHQSKNLRMDTVEWLIDVAAETVGLKSGGSEPRFRCDGTIVYSEGIELEDILKPILAAGATKVTNIGGKRAFIPATPRAPVDTIYDVIGDLKVDRLKAVDTLPTKMTGKYTNPDRGYEDADIVPYTIPGAQAADGGIPKPRDVSLLMVQSGTQAQRLLKILGHDARRQKTIGTVVKPSNLKAAAGGYVTTSFPTDYSVLNGNFELVSSEPMVSVTDRGVFLRSTVSLLEVDETGLSWVPATDEQDILNEDFDTDEGQTALPGVITVTIEEVDTGSAVISTALFKFDPSDTTSVTGYQWQYRANDDPWEDGGFIDATVDDGAGKVFGRLDLVSATDLYDIRVKAASPNGFSDWRTIEDISISLLSSGVTATGSTAHANFTGTSPASGVFSGYRLYASDEGAAYSTATEVSSGLVEVSPGASFNINFGDVVVTEELSDPPFDIPGDWTSSAGDWTVASGSATKVAGVANDFLGSSVTLDDGEDYRWSMNVASGSGGGLQFMLDGGTTVTDASGVTGWEHGVITAPVNTTDAGPRGLAAWFGSITDIHLVKDTPDALPLGTKDYWLVPVTQTGSLGTPDGPHTLTIF